MRKEMEVRHQKEYYFRIGRIRFYLVIEPDEKLPFFEIAIAIETKSMREWMRRADRIAG